ncbi:hypothetical protein A6X21_04515 [Planctopirus hydrillae]|uniref:Uncharacterized protein n=1 Tax=Planctopirus hydrillae TaxID=1841610 RepID=A0A1C3ENT9_9PLAN|nr:hypothetical protein A6X21_04515 [Planctopirus hydrillae]
MIQRFSRGSTQGSRASQNERMIPLTGMPIETLEEPGKPRSIKPINPNHHPVLADQKVETRQ